MKITIYSKIIRNNIKLNNSHLFFEDNVLINVKIFFNNNIKEVSIQEINPFREATDNIYTNQ